MTVPAPTAAPKNPFMDAPAPQQGQESGGNPFLAKAPTMPQAASEPGYLQTAGHNFGQALKASAAQTYAGLENPDIHTQSRDQFIQQSQAREGGIEGALRKWGITPSFGEQWDASQENKASGQAAQGELAKQTGGFLTGTIPRVAGGAAPLIAASVANPMLGAGVGAAQGFGSAELEGQPRAIGAERALFNAGMGLIPGGGGSGGFVKETAKGLAKAAAIQAGQATTEEALKQHMGLPSDGYGSALKQAVLSPEGATNIGMMGLAHGAGAAWENRARNGILLPDDRMSAAPAPQPVGARPSLAQIAEMQLANHPAYAPAPVAPEAAPPQEPANGTQGVREDQGQPQGQGDIGQGSQDQRGQNLQQPPPQGKPAGGPVQRPEEVAAPASKTPLGDQQEAQYKAERGGKALTKDQAAHVDMVRAVELAGGQVQPDRPAAPAPPSATPPVDIKTGQSPLVSDLLNDAHGRQSQFLYHGTPIGNEINAYGLKAGGLAADLQAAREYAGNGGYIHVFRRADIPEVPTGHNDVALSWPKGTQWPKPIATFRSKDFPGKIPNGHHSQELGDNPEPDWTATQAPTPASATPARDSATGKTNPAPTPTGDASDQGIAKQYDPKATPSFLEGLHQDETGAVPFTKPLESIARVAGAIRSGGLGLMDRFEPIRRQFGGDAAYALMQKGTASAEGEAMARGFFDRAGLPERPPKDPANLTRPEQIRQDLNDLASHNKYTLARMNGQNPTGNERPLLPAELRRISNDPDVQRIADQFNREVDPTLTRIRQQQGLPIDPKWKSMGFIMNSIPKWDEDVARVDQGPGTANRLSQQYKGSGVYEDDLFQRMKLAIGTHLKAENVARAQEVMRNEGAKYANATDPKLNLQTLNIRPGEAVEENVRVPKVLADAFNERDMNKYNRDTYNDALDKAVQLGIGAKLFGSGPGHVWRALSTTARAMGQYAPWSKYPEMAFPMLGPRAAVLRNVMELADTPKGDMYRQFISHLGAGRGTAWNLNENSAASGLERTVAKMSAPAHQLLFNQKMGADVLGRIISARSALSNMLGTTTLRSLEEQVDSGKISVGEAVDALKYQTNPDDKLRVGQIVNRRLGYSSGSTASSRLTGIKRYGPLASAMSMIPQEVQDKLTQNLNPAAVVRDVRHGEYGNATMKVVTQLASGALGTYLMKQGLNMTGSYLATGKARTMEENPKGHETDLQLGDGYWLHGGLDPSDERSGRIGGNNPGKGEGTTYGPTFNIAGHQFQPVKLNAEAALRNALNEGLSYATPPPIPSAFGAATALADPKHRGVGLQVGPGWRMYNFAGGDVNPVGGLSNLSRYGVSKVVGNQPQDTLGSASIKDAAKFGGLTITKDKD